LITRAPRTTATLMASAVVVLILPSLSARAGTAAAPTVAPPISVLASQVRPSVMAPARRHLTSSPSTVAAPAVAAPARAAALPAPGAVALVASAPSPSAPVPTVPGEEALLTIPSLGIRLPILLGGQATIDRGLVTHYNAGWRPPVAAGAPGTYWLAAHHSTHGSPFANLPSIRAGALIVIDPMSGPEIRYQETSAQVVGTAASDLTVYGADRSTPRILLQTCEGGAYRLLVHGIRIN
jgi:hypothetical protein